MAALAGVDIGCCVIPYTERSWVRIPVRTNPDCGFDRGQEYTRGTNQHCSHIAVFFSPLPLLSLSLKSVKTYPQGRIQKCNKPWPVFFSD